MLKLLTVILVIHSTQSLHPNSALYTEVFAYHNETYTKAEFAFEVVDKIYKAFRQWFFTVIFCEFTYFENRVLKYTETTGYGYPVLVLNSCPSSDRTKVKPKIDRHGQTTYVVTSDELSLDINEQVLNALFRTGVFKPRSIVVYVINTPVDVDSYFYYLMQIHFQLLWARNIANSVLIVWCEELKLYTYNPFYNVVIDITNVTNIDSFISRQYENLQGHQLRLSVFRKIYISDETGPLLCDSRLASTLMQLLNASCLPLPPRDGSTVGDILDNGTATGVTMDLLEGYTDLELNSRILKTSYYGYIDTTYPLFQDELCFLVKKADIQSSFATTIKLISVPLLIIFIFNVNFFILIGIVTRKLEAKLLHLRGQRASSTMVDVVKCLLKQTHDVKFLGSSFRLAILMIMIYSLIINCVIESIITSAITYPRYKSDIDTMQELFDSNLTFGVHNRHIKLFKSSMVDEPYGSIQNRVEIFNDKKFREVINERKYQYAILLRKNDANAISRKPANMKNGRPLFHTVHECPIPVSIVYGLRYGSPYLTRINHILHRLYQGGILQQWMKTDELTGSSNLGIILNTANGENKDKKALSIKNLEEMLYVWMIGLVISTIVFLIEMFSRSIHQFNLLTF